METSTFGSRLNPLIERLQHARIHCGNNIHRCVQLIFGHPSFPCVRKAPFNSRIAQPHHRHRKPHKHFFALTEALDRMSILVKGSEVGFFHN